MPRLRRHNDRPEFASLEPRKLLAADPVTPDHPFWAMPRGGAVIDGDLSDAAWDSALEIFRTQGTRSDNAIWVRMMWNDGGVFLSVYAQDENIWADGRGFGSGDRWEVETDDSVTFYFDPDGSRDEYLQANDYGFGINLGEFDSPKNDDSAAVRRYKYISGDGAGGAPNADFYPGTRSATSGDWEDDFLPPGAQYATMIDGTVNDATDTDVGWAVEIYLPWSTIGFDSVPAHGTTLGMNFDIIFDQDGASRNLVSNREGPNRFDVPHFIDDHVQGAHSSNKSAGAGIRGPVNYAEVMLVDARTSERPRAITNLSVAHTSPFGAQLFFTAPTGTSTSGHVSSYAVRYSTSPITNDADWKNATEFENIYTPRLSGLAERLRLAELDASTTYYVAVRGVDATGNMGSMSNVVSFTTDAPDGTQGRIIPSPSGFGLMYEDGTPFVPVGDHLGLPWKYTRTLFPGDVWDKNFNIYQNFHDNIPAEGTAAPFFAELRDAGVNTMRVYVELQGQFTDLDPDNPAGYWLENRAGQFNPNMRQFMENVMALADTYDIKLILSPFNPYDYDDVFGTEGPWSTNFGGPLTSIDDFFQTEGTLEIAQRRMEEVANWVKASPNGHTVLGYETISEWDARWTLNSEGDGSPGRENEFARRAAWMADLAAHIRDVDPDRLIMNSTVQRDPRGPVARVLFYDRTWDMLTNHFYTQGNDEGINNPDRDRTVMAAEEMGYFQAYWATHRIDNRPILNGEWGPNRTDWPNEYPQYGANYTADEDNDVFRAVIWSGFALGQIGTGLRMPGEVLIDNGVILSDTMREYQRTFGVFANDTSMDIDWASLNYRVLNGRISAGAKDQTIHAWGFSDGAAGMAYLVRDGNVTDATARNGALTIDGLSLDQIVDFEFWDPSTGVRLGVVTGVYTGDGSVTVDLPDVSADLAVKFKARERVTDTELVAAASAFGSVWTFTLDLDGKPIATITDGTTGELRTLDISALAGFSSDVVDMTAFVTPGRVLSLALTDSDRHLWLLTRSPVDGGWTATDLTALIDAPGLAGDLTAYQPSWGSIHIAGLDARGHAVNYWWSPGTNRWTHDDLKELIGGETLNSGLTGYVAPWDGLNLAGLNDAGEVIVYWWAPSLTSWQQINMTEAFDGPTFAGKLDAYVTAWGAMNIAGLDADGNVVTYWWAPGLQEDPNRWRVANLSEFSGSGPVDEGATTGLSADGGINAFAIDSDGSLIMQRWTPQSRAWASTNVEVETGAGPITSPMGVGAAGDFIVVAAQDADEGDRVLLFQYQISVDTWSVKALELAA